MSCNTCTKNNLHSHLYRHRHSQPPTHLLTMSHIKHECVHTHLCYYCYECLATFLFLPLHQVSFSLLPANICTSLARPLSFSSLVFSRCSALSLFLFTARSYLLSCSDHLLHPLFPRIFKHSLSILFHTLTLNSARVRELENLDIERRDSDRKHV